MYSVAYVAGSNTHGLGLEIHQPVSNLAGRCVVVLANKITDESTLNGLSVVESYHC